MVKIRLYPPSFLIFGIGLFLHYLGHLMSVIGEKGIVNKVCSGIGLTIMLLTLFSKIRIIPFKKGIISLVFYIYLFWILFILVRWEDDYFNVGFLDLIRLLFFDERFFLSYFVPLVLFFGKRYFELRAICLISMVYCISNIVLFLFFYNMIINAPWHATWVAEYIGLLFIPCAIILFCNKFYPTKYTIVALTSCFISLFSSSLLGRRAVTFAALFCISIFFYMLLKRSKLKVLYFILFISLLFTGYCIYTNYIVSRSNNLLAERLEVDNRSPEDRDVMNSLTALEFFIGKGVTGTYYSHALFDHRTMVESGVQHMILKGGIIYLLLHIFILSYSFFLGFFRSNNDFVKGLALYIFFKIVVLYPLGSPLFSLHEIFLWMSVLFCNDLNFRKLNNSDIKKYIYG